MLSEKPKIVYIVGGLYSPSGMGQVLSLKTNYLAEHSDYSIHIVLTEREQQPLFYKMSDNINIVNFDINFDELDTMPLFRKLYHYYIKQRTYKKKLYKYLMELKPAITVSAIRREINFINSIPDGSIKIGELHFNKSDYRVFKKKFLPRFINSYITNVWKNKLIHELKKLSHFVVLTHEDEANWTEIERISVIPNPLSFYPETTSDCSNKKVISAGRYTWQKGFERLIDAWEIVNKKHPDWKLYIYGYGDRQHYQNLANQKGLEKSLRCEPPTSNIRNEYLNSSIFVLSSRYEGFGMVIIEAMSCGIPPVSFDCPCGPKDIIEDKVTGLLVPNGNIEELANKIIWLIENESARKEMGKKSYTSARKYKIENVMKQWMDLFASVLNNPSITKQNKNA
ncbi:glycosyltransferase family 4 protein [Bacteroides sp. 224]|uniref:glycosyltransferase family 4 protein n=1 Tax=Bacteroides sp. 224 TaxID=2302936 RepID=UPI0013D87967|nr:glycosyltransferase family 4 protein [Bacteroides sp. 224]NDV65183.1 glycosyltransferase family 4 protein [Bacteroides sp. 224]